MTAARFLEFIVEEPSMEVFLRELLPRLVPGCEFEVHRHRGKKDLLRKLERRFRGYRHWMPEHSRIVVLVDRDNDDCKALKRQLEEAARKAGLRSRSRAADGCWQVVNRIVIEELEAWYFGDWDAVRQAYPNVSEAIPRRHRYRSPDAVEGGAWEAFERVLRRGGYFRNGLRKSDAARAVARHIDPRRNRSPSFKVFRDALVEATA